MVKELLLARHGQAEAPSFALDDKDRKLTPAGIQQLERLGKMLAINGQSCDYLVHSPAKRCQNTAEILARELKVKTLVSVSSIYRAGRDELLRAITDIPTGVNHALLVGHNPAISQIAAYLTGESHLVFSPGMMARIHFQEMDWEAISKNAGTLEEILQ
ncbi:SixA phosphatase family protein [Cyclobacterium jeungdonense]|uniref:Histidine phosphatase family protein n=1 Tax=Cyclobacterium jeungdonense TaxID=708087 RepID=A0ABT8C2B4_9BACT|nr:histidine phosphatase family protein [Cyclobacterium jeungdonense]MDN3686212.1 histidine phosphatase family protein [Cyclobacterium jeungdonense]